MTLPRLHKRIDLSEISNKLSYFHIYEYENNLIININYFVDIFDYNSTSYLINYYKMKEIKLKHQPKNKYVCYISIYVKYSKEVENLI